MRKIVAGILATALLATIGTVSAFAAEPAFYNSQRFADADGDGVCDNYGTRGSGQYFADADGDGVCDNYGTKGSGQCFADADGDGV